MSLPAPALAVGANLPWIEYGQDFGASAWRPQGGVAQPDLRDRMRAALVRLSAAGGSLVRWWLLADGRAGLRLDESGRPAGLDECFFPDLDAAIDALTQNGLRAVFVLTDFHWFKPKRVVNGVQLGGRSGLVRRKALRSALIGTVFAPIARRYANEPAIAAWDLLNEPDWATLGVASSDLLHSLTRRTMRRYFRDLIAAFRAEGAVQPLTVGVASARSLPLVLGLDLDLYQMHWYESHDPLDTLSQGVASRGLPRPLLLGEFPTRGASVTAGRVLELAAAAGYGGALAWSLLATDDASDCDACEAALNEWSAGVGPVPD